MGTTDNFDSATSTSIITATDTVPIIRSATGRAATATLDLITPVSGKSRFYNTGSSSLGALTALDTAGRAMTANTMWSSTIYITNPCVLLGGGVLNGTTVGTTKSFVALYNAAGTLVANSSVTSGGAVSVGASVFQERLFTTAYTAKPGLYWLGLHPDTTTDTVRTIVAATYVDINTTSTVGAAATATTSITPVTTFTANLGIFSYLYTA